MEQSLRSARRAAPMECRGDEQPFCEIATTSALYDLLFTDALEALPRRCIEAVEIGVPVLVDGPALDAVEHREGGGRVLEQDLERAAPHEANRLAGGVRKLERVEGVCIQR